MFSCQFFLGGKSKIAILIGVKNRLLGLVLSKGKMSVCAGVYFILL